MPFALILRYFIIIVSYLLLCCCYQLNINITIYFDNLAPNLRTRKHTHIHPYALQFACNSSIFVWWNCWSSYLPYYTHLRPSKRRLRDAERQVTRTHVLLFYASGPYTIGTGKKYKKWAKRRRWCMPCWSPLIETSRWPNVVLRSNSSFYKTKKKKHR